MNDDRNNANEKMRTKYTGRGTVFDEMTHYRKRTCWTLGNNFTRKLMTFLVGIVIRGIHKCNISLWFWHLGFKGLSERESFW